MRRGFTLIELVMVIVILGILAATALPRFIDLSNKAKESAAKGALGGIRAAVSITYVSNAAYTTASFPASITAVMFADSIIPQEPYTPTNTITVGTSLLLTGTTGGWLYEAAAGRVWLNHSAYSTY